MTKADLKRYKSVLTAKMAEVSRSLGSRSVIAVEIAPEACEEMVLAAHRELSITTLERNSRLLREVQAAMGRIEDGSYGVCESCGQPIKAKRLEAVPWARRCVACQEGIDRDPGPASRLSLAA
jgi:DnaK suppressor protein